MPFRVTSISQFYEKTAEAASSNQYILILWMRPHCYVCTQSAVPAFAKAEASGNYRNIMFLEMDHEAFFHRGPLGAVGKTDEHGKRLPRCVLCRGEQVTGVPTFHLLLTSKRHMKFCHRETSFDKGPYETPTKICCFCYGCLVDGWDESQFFSMLSRTSQPPNPLSIGITLSDGPAAPTIETVAAHGPAGLSGQVFPGDFVISVNGAPCTSPMVTKLGFIQLMNGACAAGSDVELVLMRGDASPLSVRLTPVRIDSFDKTPWFLSCEIFEASALSKRVAARFRLGVTCVDKDGCTGPVIGTVEPDGPAGLSGQVFPDDIIISWNDIPCKGLTTKDMYTRVMQSQGTSAVCTADIVKLEIQRKGAPDPVVIHLVPSHTKPATLGLTMCERSKIDGRTGISIESVNPRGPAGLSGQVFPDDIIISWNDIPCKGLTLAELEPLRAKSEGLLFAHDDVKLELQRDGARDPVIVNLTPMFFASPLVCRGPGHLGWHEPYWFQIGITITENPDGPIVATVNPQGPAGLSGQVVAGDVIVSWNGVSRKNYTKQQMMDVSCCNWMGADVHLELQRSGEPHLISVCLTPVSPQEGYSWLAHVSKTAPLDEAVVVEPGCYYAKDREALQTFGGIQKGFLGGGYCGFYEQAEKAHILKKKFGRHGWKGLDELFPEGYRRNKYREEVAEMESFMRAMDANPSIWSLYFQEEDL
jgi:C-terminal processing protease CtpA/Prc